MAKPIGDTGGTLEERTIMEWTRDGFTVTTDPARFDVDKIYAYLSEESYWAKGRPREIIETAIRHSLGFALLKDDDKDTQVGFARVTTDYATFAWLADVYVEPTLQGQGLGKFLMGCVMTHPELQNLNRWLLATADAHGLYEQFGFTRAADHPRLMERREKQR